MSITKGAMLISNANAVGTELVNKLGGTGYKPVEWADAINLLGISNDDKASALASITEGTYTGDERGSIKYNNCNAVGSMLNKKFSTDRGFKPVEWESAISKLTPLAERTVSGAIVTFSDGADDVPTKSLKVTMPPTLSGVSEVTETQTGRNLASELLEWNATNRIISPIFLKSGTYTVSFQRSVSPSAIYIRKGDTIRLGGDAYATKYSSVFFTFTADESTYYYVQIYRSASSTTWEEAPVTNVQIEYGSTAHDYEPYTAPTQYTASLGRTIHGGQVDIVNGVGSNGYGKITDFSGLTANGTSSTGAYRYRLNVADCAIYTDRQAISSEPLTFRASFNGSVNEFYNASGYLLIFLSQDNVADAIEYLTGVSIVYPLATPTDFTFDGQEIPTRLGYNAFWSEQGDTEVTYRRDIDLALQSLSGSRGLMMARPPAAAETEETEPEDETTDTIEETPEDMEK